METRALITFFKMSLFSQYFPIIQRVSTLYIYRTVNFCGSHLWVTITGCPGGFSLKFSGFLHDACLLKVLKWVRRKVMFWLSGHLSWSSTTKIRAPSPWIIPLVNLAFLFPVQDSLKIKNIWRWQKALRLQEMKSGLVSVASVSHERACQEIMSCESGC